MAEGTPGRSANRARLIGRYRHDQSASVGWDRLHRGPLLHPIPFDPGWDGAERWELALPPAPHLAAAMHERLRTGRCCEVVAAIGAFPFDRMDFDVCGELHNALCLAYARQGLAEEAERVLALAPRFIESRFGQIALTAFCRVSYSVVPPMEMLVPILEEGWDLPEREHDHGYHGNVYEQARIRVLIAAGRLDEAVQACRRFLSRTDDGALPRMRARTRCSLAEALRRIGCRDPARDQLYWALASQGRIGAMGDLCEHSLTLLARTSGKPEARRELDEAERLVRPLEIGRGACRERV
mgnify:CR=1 FL=1